MGQNVCHSQNLPGRPSVAHTRLSFLPLVLAYCSPVDDVETSRTPCDLFDFVSASALLALRTAAPVRVLAETATGIHFLNAHHLHNATSLSRRPLDRQLTFPYFPLQTAGAAARPPFPCHRVSWDETDIVFWNRSTIQNLAPRLAHTETQTKKDKRRREGLLRRRRRRVRHAPTVPPEGAVLRVHDAAQAGCGCEAKGGGPEGVDGGGGGAGGDGQGGGGGGRGGRGCE